jgi:hypothetical protein
MVKASLSRIGCRRDLAATAGPLTFCKTHREKACAGKRSSRTRKPAKYCFAKTAVREKIILPIR